VRPLVFLVATLAACASKPHEPLRLRVLCADAGGLVDPLVDTCRPGGQLRIMVGGSAQPRVAVLALHLDGTVDWLHPKSDAEPLLKMPAELTPLPGSAQLGRAPVRIAAIAVATEHLDAALIEWAKRAPSGSSQNAAAEMAAIDVPVL
jgi:hypothetical protein